ncbi:hypothetical protein [Neorhodopirellula lusitana]|nr:hypothetical protein [Neorhodopirellula lusitana]
MQQALVAIMTSPQNHSEANAMFTNLIASPSTHESATKRPSSTPVVRGRSLRDAEKQRSAKKLAESTREEGAYIFNLVACMFALLVLPAVLALLFLLVNPDAFMIDIGSGADFSTWQPGQRP